MSIAVAVIPQPNDAATSNVSDRLQALWSSLNKMAEELSKGHAVGDDATSAHKKAEEELSRITRQIKGYLALNNKGDADADTANDTAPLSPVERAQLNDLLQLLDEIRQMQGAHKARRREREGKSTTTGEAEKKKSSSGKLSSLNSSASSTSVTIHTTTDATKDAAITNIKRALGELAEDGQTDNESSNSDEDESIEVVKARRAAAKAAHMEAQHKETVDAVMAVMEAHLPKATITTNELDAQAFEMSLMLLRDEDVRGSFVQLKDPLTVWLSAATENAHNYTPSDMARFEAQLRVVTAMELMFTTDADTITAINDTSSDPSTNPILSSVASRFNVLMNELTSLGEAPNGLYGA